MKIKTRYHEEIEVNKEDKIVFSSGIPGFPEEKEFIVLPLSDDSPFSILQSINNEDLGFVIAEPFSFYKDYEFDLEESVVTQLNIVEKTDIQIYSIVTLGESLSTSTINLQAPVIINRKKNTGKQAILNTDTYHTKHPLVKKINEKSQEG
ncbi:flagellar assembly protein FliW [Bacillus sp. FJAT-49705]|uniref:Flagellar assembly factor FliW n=1 Tax=Cytobacillus citreus TaxID=2833586 RepID=A0ABS5NR03_9BACI|nr:flagellar assembly protein FliW [Cytobacillus citreus]